MEMLEVDGLRIAYERAGDGPSLVLLHGYVGDGPTTWRQQLDGLSDEFTVVAWDAPGAGGSSDPPTQNGRFAARRRGRASPPPGVRAGRAVAGEFVAALLPTMFSDTTARESVDAFGAGMLAFHPVGFRAMASASAENLRDALPGIGVPTLLLYGDQDVRAGPRVGEDLRAAIPGSKLVVLPRVGHVCNLEAPAPFNAAVRTFLREQLRPG